MSADQPNPLDGLEIIGATHPPERELSAPKKAIDDEHPHPSGWPTPRSPQEFGGKVEPLGKDHISPVVYEPPPKSKTKIKPSAPAKPLTKGEERIALGGVSGKDEYLDALKRTATAQEKLASQLEKLVPALAKLGDTLARALKEK